MQDRLPQNSRKLSTGRLAEGLKILRNSQYISLKLSYNSLLRYWHGVSPSVVRTDIPQRVEAAVRAVLPRAVEVQVAQHDSAVDLTINGMLVEAKWVGEGGLRQARELLAQRPARRPSIVVARRMSPGAREALSAAGVGWVDETGAAEITLGPLVVARSGRPDKPGARVPRWTPSVLAVAEALLCGTKATVAATQRATGLSAGSCTHALRTLSDLKLLTSKTPRGRESARSVADPEQLLDAYATAAAAKAPVTILTVGVTWRDVAAGLAEAGRSWDNAGVAWAVTGAVAASVIAPYLTSITTGEVYVAAETIAGLEAVATEAGLRPIEGGRITLLPFPTVTTRLLATARDSLRVAPWPRVYADLRTSGVRGEEAAEHLREVIHAQ